MGGQVDFFIYLSPGRLKIILEFLALETERERERERERESRQTKSL